MVGIVILSRVKCEDVNVREASRLANQRRPFPAHSALLDIEAGADFAMRWRRPRLPSGGLFHFKAPTVHALEVPRSIISGAPEPIGFERQRNNRFDHLAAEHVCHQWATERCTTNAIDNVVDRRQAHRVSFLYANLVGRSAASPSLRRLSSS